MSAAPAPVSTLRSVAQQVVQTTAVALFAKPSADYADKLAQAQDCLRQAAALGAVTQANSLGVEDMVITHIAQQLQLNLPVFVLDTGRLHTETLALLERLQAQEGVDVTVYHPQAEAVRDYIRQHGQDALYDSIALRKQCCDMRKMEPLARALAGQKGWVTGLRREQSSARAAVPLVDTSEPRTKFNPLANWTQGDVWHYVAEHGVDTNPLHDQFYPSIGCAPCTRPVTLGEDFRAGRWWWEDEAAKECGLHVKDSNSLPLWGRVGVGANHLPDDPSGPHPHLPPAVEGASQKAHA